MLILDVTISAEFNIVEKEYEKILKYQDLCLKQQQIWNLRMIKFVNGATGSFIPNF